MALRNRSDADWTNFDVAFTLLIFMWGWHRIRSSEERRRMSRQLRAATAATVGVESATARVENAIADMSLETSRAQRLAIWVAVGTAVLGALIGGVAGAVAAHVIG